MKAKRKAKAHKRKKVKGGEKEGKRRRRGGEGDMNKAMVPKGRNKKARKNKEKNWW